LLGDRPHPDAELSALAAEAASDEIAGLAEHSTVALLCGSVEPTHRVTAASLALHLAARGLHLMHIGPDGVAEPHQEQLGL